MGRIVSNSRERHAPKILGQLRTGAALAEICRADGMPTRETVRLWCRDDPAFAAQVLRARDDGHLECAERAVKAAMQRVIVAVDPSGTRGEAAPKASGKSTGGDVRIVAAGRGTDGRGYLLEDESCNLSP